MSTLVPFGGITAHVRTRFGHGASATPLYESRMLGRVPDLDVVRQARSDARARSRRPSCSARTVSTPAVSRSRASTRSSRSTPTRCTRASSRMRRGSRPTRPRRRCATAGLDGDRGRRARREHVHGVSVPRAERLRRRAARPARATCSRSISSATVAPRRCRIGSSPTRCSRRGRCAQRASRFASSSAAPRCISTTIRAC